MTIKITNTNVAAENVKVLVYGPAGIGKTKLCSTLPNNLIISAEAGLLSLADFDIDVVEINSINDLGEVYSYIDTSKEARNKYENLSLDSVSEIAEVLLSKLLAENKDPRKAYGELANQMTRIIRKFRDIKGYNVYFSAKMAKITDDESGIINYFPMMPGTQLKQGLSYFFDEVFVMRIGKTPNGTKYRYLQTQPDSQYEAKDRSDKLKPIVKPDLSVVFKKILREKTSNDNTDKVVVKENTEELIEVIPEEVELETDTEEKAAADTKADTKTKS